MSLKVSRSFFNTKTMSFLDRSKAFTSSNKTKLIFGILTNDAFVDSSSALTKRVALESCKPTFFNASNACEVLGTLDSNDQSNNNTFLSFNKSPINLFKTLVFKVLGTDNLRTLG